MAAKVKGFGRRPQHDGACGLGAGVRKPPKEETAGRRGYVRARATYGDLKVAGWTLVSLQGAQARNFVGLDAVGGLG